MGVAEEFEEFLKNLQIVRQDKFSLRYGEITNALNKKYRDVESKTNYRLQVGSYGRWTGIKGISDLDMIFIMPSSAWNDYKDGGQSKLLKDAKTAIANRYPTTNMKVDRCVVRAEYSDFHVEVQPAFQQADGSFTYPDTYGSGSWKTTKPRLEIEEIKTKNEEKNRNLRRLCKMARAWKNKHGVPIGGLLVDTLAYNFLCSTEEYDERGWLWYDFMSRDFFEYLKDETDKAYYQALGSKQHVKVRKKFQKKAKKAYELSLDAIAATTDATRRSRWRKVYGSAYPAPQKLEKAAYDAVFKQTEEFIEDRFPVDIRYNIELDCTVTQNGFRAATLMEMLTRGTPLLPKKDLRFQIVRDNLPHGCIIFWKVLNTGSIAERRDQIRGQIVPDGGGRGKTEKSSFRGEHIVEVFAVANGVVVARDEILVPIS